MIFVALAVVWAVFLIPKALRHHDEVAKTRSVDTVSDSARVLARREAVSRRDSELVLPATVPAPRESTEPVEIGAPAPVVPAPRKSSSRRAAAAAARRRRRVLGGLLVVDLVVGLVASFGLLAAWSPAVPVAVTVAYLVLCRVLVRRERSVGTVRTAAPVTRDVAEGSVPAQTVRNDQGVAVVSAGEDTAIFEAALLAEAVTTTDGGSLWDPLPMTLPTYVSAPRATRSVRTIDLRLPDVASSGRDAADSALVAETKAAEAAEKGREEGLPPVQRAVGD